MRNLASAIVLQAIKDLREERFRSDAREFFNSSWFITIAEILDLDPKIVRNKVEAGTDLQMKIRSAYH